MGRTESALHDKAKKLSSFNSHGATLLSFGLQLGALPDENHSIFFFFCKTKAPFSNNHKKRRGSSCHNGPFSSILATERAWLQDFFRSAAERQEAQETAPAAKACQGSIRAESYPQKC